MSGRLRRAFAVLFHVEDSPHRIALAFGLGVFIAFSPLLGLHTAMALGIAVLLRLSKAAIIIGIYVNNPWTIAPMYMAGTLLGCGMLGVSTDDLSSLRFDEHGWAFYRTLAHQLEPYLWPFVVGNTILGVVFGALGYVVLRRVLERRRRTAAAATTA
ncbi:MAG TPA: DUF2062 domain-containing protein [Vicinamibacteria bacterium]|jgi:uncharacterized protein (DUF2062 family)